MFLVPSPHYLAWNEWPICPTCSCTQATHSTPGSQRGFRDCCSKGQQVHEHPTSIIIPLNWGISWRPNSALRDTGHEFLKAHLYPCSCQAQQAKVWMLCEEAVSCPRRDILLGTESPVSAIKGIQVPGGEKRSRKPFRTNVFFLDNSLKAFPVQD